MKPLITLLSSFVIASLRSPLRGSTRFAVLAVSLCSALHSSLAAERPNILFLFADDQRYDTLGCSGHPIVQTPTIDRLAAQGVRFSNAHVTTAVCWVSRAVVLTGQWQRKRRPRPLAQ